MMRKPSSVGLSLIEYLNILDAGTCAKIYCDFNRWKWPTDLPNKYKPQWWDDDDFNAAYGRSRQYGYWSALSPSLMKKAGKKLIDEEWNK